MSYDKYLLRVGCLQLKMTSWSEHDNEVMSERLEVGTVDVLEYLFELEKIKGYFDYHQNREVVLRSAVKTNKLEIVMHIINLESQPLPSSRIYSIHP